MDAFRVHAVDTGAAAVACPVDTGCVCVCIYMFEDLYVSVCARKTDDADGCKCMVNSEYGGSGGRQAPTTVCVRAMGVMGVPSAGKTAPPSW